MESFKFYLERNKPTYKFKVKIAIDELTDHHIDKIETCLSKYELVSASKFKKTPIQDNPIDFANIKNLPVYISDIEIKYPSTCNQLQNIISEATKISAQAIAIYGSADSRKDIVDIFNKDLSDKPTKLSKGDYDGEEEEGESHKDSSMKFLSDLETQISLDKFVGTEKSDDLPKGYTDRPEEDNTVSLFGRIKKKD